MRDKAMFLAASMAAFACHGSSCIGAHAFVQPQRAPLAESFRSRSVTPRHVTVLRSRENNNDETDVNPLVRGVRRADRILARRMQRADRIEVLNDAALLFGYVLGRFLVSEAVHLVAEIETGWKLQDLVWLTGTFSSATVLSTFYIFAGMLTRSYEATPWSTPPPPAKALVNVFLCCPMWLVAEHLLGYGPPNISGDTFVDATVNGLVGLGLFMSLAKTSSKLR